MLRAWPAFPQTCAAVDLAMPVEEEPVLCVEGWARGFFGVPDARPVPASPKLVEILRRHIGTFRSGPDGRMFITRLGRAQDWG
jgi:hypothetical protein